MTPTISDLRAKRPQIFDSELTRLQDKIFDLLHRYSKGDKGAQAKGISLTKQFTIIAKAQTRRKRF